MDNLFFLTVCGFISTFYFQCTSQKDYAVYLIPTPGEEGEEEPDEESEASEESRQITLKLDDVSIHWVAEHARLRKKLLKITFCICVSKLVVVRTVVFQKLMR